MPVMLFGGGLAPSTSQRARQAVVRQRRVGQIRRVMIAPRYGSVARLRVRADRDRRTSR
jgi:hypothetical protein